MTDKLAIEQQSQAIEPRRELFPHAGVPGVISLAEIEAAWTARGLKMQEANRADLLQRIEIVHDPLDGQITVNTHGPQSSAMVQLLMINAIVMMPCLIVADATMSMLEYFTTGPGKIDMETGEAKVFIGFKDGRLVVGIDPPDNQLAAEKLLGRALLYLLAKSNGLPLERFLKAFGWDKNESE